MNDPRKRRKFYASINDQVREISERTKARNFHKRTRSPFVWNIEGSKCKLFPWQYIFPIRPIFTFHALSSRHLSIYRTQPLSPQILSFQLRNKHVEDETYFSAIRRSWGKVGPRSIEFSRLLLIRYRQPLHTYRYVAIINSRKWRWIDPESDHACSKCLRIAYLNKSGFHSRFI